MYYFIITGKRVCGVFSAVTSSGLLLLLRKWKACGFRYCSFKTTACRAKPESDLSGEDDAISPGDFGGVEKNIRRAWPVIGYRAVTLLRRNGPALTPWPLTPWP